MPDHLMNTIVRKPVNITGGTGCRVVDDSNKEYIDLFGDVGTAALGYWPDEWSKAMKTLRDGQVPIHSPNMLDHPWRSKLAEAWCRATRMDRAFFSMSGSEAVETAIKITRRMRNGVIWAERGGFHGRTYAAMSASDSAPYHKDGFGPLVPDFRYFSHPSEIVGDVCAILIAPVFGNNDVLLYDERWWDALWAVREGTSGNKGATVIFDEVQTGAGRCGDWTYATLEGMSPDIICLGKGVAMGAPMGLTLARNAAATALTPGSHFSTFGGAPFGCIFGLEMVEWLTKNMSTIPLLALLLRDLINARPWMTNVRGVGMLIAADVNVPARLLADEALRRGLILGAFRDNALKITPPLNIAPADLVDAFERLDLAYHAVRLGRSGK